MQFKEGDIVRLKSPTEKEKQKSRLTYFDKFKKYEGLTATILSVTRNETYKIHIHTTLENTKFFYEELWLEKLTEFEAF